MLLLLASHVEPLVLKLLIDGDDHTDRGRQRSSRLTKVADRHRNLVELDHYFFSARYGGLQRRFLSPFMMKNDEAAAHKISSTITEPAGAYEAR